MKAPLSAVFVSGTPGNQAWVKRIAAPVFGATYVETIYDSFADGMPELRFTAQMPTVGTRMDRMICFLNGLDVNRLWQVNAFNAAGKSMWAISELTIVIPYMGVAVQDRADDDLQICTSAAWAKDVKGDLIVLVDPHAVHTKEFFKKKTRMVSAMPLLCSLMPSDAMVVFPDAGAFKRYGKIFHQHDVLTCEKIRSGADRSVRLCNAESVDLVQDREVWIIDDMVQSGATLAACQQALKCAGVANVNVAIVHAVLPTLPVHDDMTFTDASNYVGNAFFQAAVAGDIKKIYVTDTIPGRGDNLQKLLMARAARCEVRVVPVIDVIKNALTCSG